MDSILTLISQLPHGSDKYESLLLWKLQAEKADLIRVAALAMTESAVRVDPREKEYGDSLLTENFNRIYGASHIAELVVHFFPSRYAACESKMEQFDLFVESAKRIERIFQESRILASYFRDCAKILPINPKVRTDPVTMQDEVELESIHSKFDSIWDVLNHPSGIPPSLLQPGTACQLKQLTRKQQDLSWCIHSVTLANRKPDTTYMRTKVQLYRGYLLDLSRELQVLLSPTTSDGQMEKNSELPAQQ